MAEDDQLRCIKKCLEDKGGGMPVGRGGPYTSTLAEQGAVLLVRNDSKLRAWMTENGLDPADGTSALMSLFLLSMTKPESNLPNLGASA